jgi:hypothetical protein
MGRAPDFDGCHGKSWVKPVFRQGECCESPLSGMGMRVCGPVTGALWGGKFQLIKNFGISLDGLRCFTYFGILGGFQKITHQIWCVETPISAIYRRITPRFWGSLGKIPKLFS